MTEWDDTAWAGTSAGLIVPKSRKAVTGPGVAAYFGGTPLSSLRSTPQERAAQYLQAYKCGWFYKAESKISRDLAMLSVSVAPEDEEGDNETTIIEPDLFTPWEQLDPIGQFLRLMERPNPKQTGRQLRQKTQIRIDMAGAAFWYLESPSPFSLPTAIYGISPARMWPSFDKAGNLIGWVMDRNAPSGGVPFEVGEILPFSTASADDGDYFGVGVVEAVFAELPLTDLMARHTADLLTTGGRLAGMMWPKERSLDEAEFQDAQRAWRNVASDPNAARRLLIFPEPMEWANGASTPAEIGIPELASLNRDNILTAFPISPYQLGVPEPGGLNSGETRKEDRRDYWEGTIHPRVEMFEETVQIGLLSRYEAVVGSTFDFDITEPNLDDAASLTLKVAAYNDLVSAGFDDTDARKAVGLEGIKYKALPALLDPVQQANAAQAAAEARAQNPNPFPPKSEKRTREEDQIAGAQRRAKDALASFFGQQRDRVLESIRKTLPSSKAARQQAAKSDPKWWDGKAEDDALTAVMRAIYAEVGREGLQTVADTLNRTVMPRFHRNVIADLLQYGGARVKDINDRTLQAIVVDLAEGTRRGYSVNQLIDGVPDEGFAGIGQVTLENGTLAFSDARAEMIARTETMLSYNRANLLGYGEFGVSEVLAYDGDGDEECAARDGQTFSIDDALAIEDHPNGTLDWAPVVEKSEKADPILVLAEALKAIAMRDQLQPLTNVFVEPAKAPDVFVTTPDVAAPVVNVEPTAVQVDVHIPEPKPRKLIRNKAGDIEGLE